MPRLSLLLIGSGLFALSTSRAMALPPPDEIPEEILRTEVIVEARSPLNGAPISAADYATLQDHLQDPNIDVLVSSDLVQLIQLLQLRRVFRPILPFLQ